jgi:hypothetical protein
MATLKQVRRRRQVIAIVAIAIITAGVGGGSILSMGARNISSPIFTQSSPILNELVAVEAGSFKHFEFNVPEEIKNAAVTGSFSSAGSNLDSDVVISVIPESALQNIMEDKAYPAFYFSGKTASGEVNADILEMGTMYVIVDNRFSDTPKVVDVNIALAY